MTTREVEQLLLAIARTGVAPVTVNRYRSAISAVFSYGIRPSTFGLASHPVTHADRRAEPIPAHLAFYSPEEIETLAGLRRGELVALKWRDVDLGARKLVVRRSISDMQEMTSTKSRRSREVPIPDQAEAAFRRLQSRVDFTSPDDYVFVNRLGRSPTPQPYAAARTARNAAGLEPLRFHDLRHTYRSLLVAGGIDLVSVKAAMGHSHISTTGRYLHARPAADQADRFTRALSQSDRSTADRPRRPGAAQPPTRPGRKRKSRDAA